MGIRNTSTLFDDRDDSSGIQSFPFTIWLMWKLGGPTLAPSLKEKTRETSSSELTANLVALSFAYG